MVATVSVFNPTVSVLVGIVLFDERLSDPTWHKVAAFVGIGVAILGALAVSFAHSGEPGETADPLSTGDGRPGDVSPPS